VSLEPEVGAPTFYRGGVAVPDASVTPEGQGSDARGWPFALFTNLPEGEYAVRSERDDRRCRALGGWNWYAFSDSRENAIRAPVLAEHFTVVAAFCECLVPQGATSCPAPDGGAASQ